MIHFFLNETTELKKVLLRQRILAPHTVCCIVAVGDQKRRDLWDKYEGHDSNFSGPPSSHIFTQTVTSRNQTYF